ncbi:TonB-dependent receptor [Elongatibacter sediminis]|uniref:TonB-dependent receptor n=1 Tax=Elongatibacter sediminis TaxID=3119006 RepID=A0AAW9R8P9_9GAMM
MTATRRAESLSKVPLAISAVGQQDIEEFGYTNMESFYRSVPSVSLLDGGAQQKQMIIRGVTVQASAEAKAATGIYVDETLVSGNFSNLDPRIFDMQRVEVLRGPQGTLFGGGSIAGSVRYITNKPNPNEFEANFAADINNSKDADTGYSVDAMVNVPLIENTLGLRFVAFHSDNPGIYQNSQFDLDDQASYDQTGGRVSLRWTPTDTFTLTGMYLTDNSDQDGWSRAHGEDWRALDQVNLIPEKLSADAEVLSLTAEWDVGWVTITSVTSQLNIESDYRKDFSFFGFDEYWEPLRFGTQGFFDDSSFTQELRFVSDPEQFEKVDWIAGLYYADRENREDFRDCFSIDEDGFDSIAVNYANAGPRFADAVPGQDLVYPYPANHEDIFASGTEFGPQDSVAEGVYPSCLYREHERLPYDELAFYGELSYHFTDRLTGTIGYRHTEESKSGLLKAQIADFGPEVFNEVEESPEFDETHDNFMFNLSFDMTETTTLYARAAEGFRVASGSAGANFSPGCEAEVLDQLGFIPGGVKSDSLWAYEAGLKFRSEDGRLSLNAGVFRNDWSDIQVEVIIDSGTDNCNLFVALNQNVGEATGNGVEFDVAWLVTDQVELSFSGSYVDFTLDEDVPFLNAAEGDRLPSHPDLSLHGSAVYNFPLSGQWTGFVRAEVSYTGEILGNFNTDPTLDRPSAGEYTLANVRAGVSNDRWEVALYVNNLFDKHATSFQYIDWTERLESLVVRPLTVGMSVRTTF